MERLCSLPRRGQSNGRVTIPKNGKRNSVRQNETFYFDDVKKFLKFSRFFLVDIINRTIFAP